MLRVAVLLAAGVLLPAAHASTLFPAVAGITGENPTPGYPGAMPVQSFTVAVTSAR